MINENGISSDYSTLSYLIEANELELIEYVYNDVKREDKYSGGPKFHSYPSYIKTAINGGSIRTLKLIIELGEKISTSSLRTAVKKNDLRLVKWMLKHYSEYFIVSDVINYSRNTEIDMVLKRYLRVSLIMRLNW